MTRYIVTPLLVAICLPAAAQLTPNEPQFDNGPVLSRMLKADGVAEFGAGDYHFHTAPDLDLPAFAMTGTALAQRGYQHFGPNKFTRLIWHGDGLFLDVPYELPKTDRQPGPFVFRNLLFYGAGENQSLLRIGNAADTSRNFGHSYGTHISGCTFWLEGQKWFASTHPEHRNFVLADGKINRESPRGFCARIIKGYRTVIRDTDFRGGFYGLDLRHCDGPRVDNVFTHLQIFGATHRSNPSGYASVPGTWDITCEQNGGGCGLWIDSGLVTFRGETGYRQLPTQYGRLDTPIKQWRIRARSCWIEVDMTGDAQDYFERYLPVEVVTGDGKSYYLLPVEINAGRLRFENHEFQCRFSKDVSGRIIRRFFGTNFVAKGHRAQLTGPQSWGINSSVPNLPIGFVVLDHGPIAIAGANVGWGNFDKTNRVAVIGHAKGDKRHNTRLDYIGGADILAPVNPFVARVK